MKRRMPAVLSLLLLVGLVLILPGRVTGDVQLQEPTANIGPGVLEALEHESEVRVHISLTRLDSPLVEQTSEMQRQHAADVQATVLAVLSPADFTLLYQFELTAALSGMITQSGLQKLATHPAVTSITIPSTGEWLDIASEEASGER